MVDQYAETVAAGNPFSANVASGTDAMNVAALGMQYTHLLDGDFELGVNGSADWAFDNSSGLKATIGGVSLTPAQPDLVYYEAGGRVGFRVASGVTIDVYANAILAPRKIGSSIHEGIGVRWTF